MSAHCYSHNITVTLSKQTSGHFEIFMTLTHLKRNISIIERQIKEKYQGGDTCYFQRFQNIDLNYFLIFEEYLDMNIAKPPGRQSLAVWSLLVSPGHAAVCSVQTFTFLLSQSVVIPCLLRQNINMSSFTPHTS